MTSEIWRIGMFTRLISGLLLSLACMSTLRAETFKNDIEIVAFFPYHCNKELMVQM